MTAHFDVHDGRGAAGPVRQKRRPRRRLMLALLGAAVAAVLLLLGVPLSVVLYGALIGGMILMHAGGHGGHGSPGGHVAHGPGGQDVVAPGGEADDGRALRGGH